MTESDTRPSTPPPAVSVVDPPADRSTPGDERLGQVTGDRRCHVCWFNLRGQVIVREPHYKMVMVRCPECGTPSPLLDYPRLGPWGRRFGVFAAMVYLAATVGLLLGVGGVVAAIADLSASEAVAPLGLHISSECIDWAKAQSTTANAKNAPNSWLAQTDPSASGWIDGKWWAGADRAAIMAAVPSPHRPFAANVAFTWLVACLPLLPMSCVLGCLVSHLRGRRLLLIPAACAAFAVVITVIGMAESGRPAMIRTADIAARNMLGHGVIALQLAMVSLPVVAGVFAGRPVARGLVRWLVPPRQWAHFGFLWAADRRAMPIPPRS